MKVKVEFTVAGKTKDCSREFPFTMHPPLQDGSSNAASSSAAAAGSSSSARPLDMSDMAPALPEYERPPEYDEANEGPPAPQINDEKSRTPFN